MPFSLLPDMIYPAITDIAPQQLQSLGIKWLLLDFDNTIVPYTTDEPTDAVVEWIERMRQAGIHLCIVSNSRRMRVRTFAEKYGLALVTGAKKPFQRGIRKAEEYFDFTKAETALVGDQIYTDVLGANCGGLTSVLVTSINNHTIWLKLRHLAELPFIAMGRRKIRRERSEKVR